MLKKQTKISGKPIKKVIKDGYNPRPTESATSRPTPTPPPPPKKS